MSENKIIDGLMQLGYNSGWVVQGEEIVLWENDASVPTMESILEAAKDYVKPEPTIDDKLASVGLSIAELKAALSD